MHSLFVTNCTLLTFKSFGRWSSIQVYSPIPYVRRTASGRCTGRTSIAFHLRRVQRATCLSALDAVNIVVVHLGLGQYVYLGHSSFWFCHLRSPRPSEIERWAYHRLIAAISQEIRKEALKREKRWKLIFYRRFLIFTLSNFIFDFWHFQCSAYIWHLAFSRIFFLINTDKVSPFWSLYRSFLRSRIELSFLTRRMKWLSNVRV